MATNFGFASGIPGRKVRQIWHSIDSGQFKNAFKLTTSLLAKHPNSPYVLALKALILERMGKPEEALSVCLNAKELLFANDTLLMDGLTLGTLQIVFQRLDHLNLATSCYEHACSKFPNTLELMMGLFNCYVREYSFVKQQRTAIKMYKLLEEERFLLWAVCSIQLQVLRGNGGDKLLLYAEGLLKKHVASHSLHEPEALRVYISILEQQAKYGDALELLSGKLESLLAVRVEKLRIQGRLLARAGDYASAANIFQKILESSPDDWESFLHYLGCLLEDDSIWCDKAVNDPIHPQKVIKHKISRLTDELFDNRISDASAFIQKLQADNINSSIRRPHLATIEIEMRKHLQGKGNDDNLIDAIVQYFGRFGHLSCFTSDVEIFTEVLIPDKKTELLEKLMKNSGALSTTPTKMLGQSVTLFKIQQLLTENMFKMSESELEVSSIQMTEMYCKNVPLSKDLYPHESMHGEELLSLTCDALIQLFLRTKNFGFLAEAIMVLEFGLAIRRNVWQYKISLLHLYAHFGALPVAYEWYKSLGVKNMLSETVSHHILPHMVASPLWVELNSLLKDYTKFMGDYLRKSSDLTFLAYRNRNYSKVIEFVQFKERLQHSSQYLVARVETPILQLKQNADNIEEEEVALENLKCGMDLLELSNEIGSQTLNFNEDLYTLWWEEPTTEKNHLLGPFEGISYCPREILTKDRETKDSETSIRRVIEKKSILSRMIYLSIRTASASVKEHAEVNGSVPGKISSELKLLLERYAQMLGYSLSEAIEVVVGSSSGERSSAVFNSNLIDWLNFIVFLNAWSLGSHELAQPDGNGWKPRTWSILDSLLEEYILGKVKSMEPQLCAPWNDVQLLFLLITEPLAWHGLVVQSFLRSSLPSGKRKKKSESVDQSSSNLVQTMADSVQHLSFIVEEVMKWLREFTDRPEDEHLEDFLVPLRSSGQSGQPGKVFHILETFLSSMNDAELGSHVTESLTSWSTADVARKMVTGKLKVLMQFFKMCESKAKLLHSMKQQIAQL